MLCKKTEFEAVLEKTGETNLSWKNKGGLVKNDGVDSIKDFFILPKLWIN